MKDLLRFDPHGTWFSLTAQSPPLPPAHFFFPSRSSHNPTSTSATGDDGITPESERLATPDRVLSPDGGEAASVSGGGFPPPSSPTYVFQCAEPDCLALLYTLNRVRHFCLNAKLRVAAAAKVSQEGFLMEPAEGGGDGGGEQDDEGKEREDDNSGVGGYAYASSPSCQMQGARTLMHHSQQLGAMQPSPVKGGGGLIHPQHHRTHQFSPYSAGAMTAFPPASYPLNQTGLPTHSIHSGPPGGGGGAPHVLSAPPRPSMVPGGNDEGPGESATLHTAALQTSSFSSPSLMEKKFCFGGSGQEGVAHQVGVSGHPLSHIKEETDDERTRSIVPADTFPPSNRPSLLEGNASAFGEGISPRHSLVFASEEREEQGTGEKPVEAETGREGSGFGSDPLGAQDSSPVNSQASPSSSISRQEGARRDEETGGVFRNTRRSRRSPQVSSEQQTFQQCEVTSSTSWAEHSFSNVTGEEEGSIRNGQGKHGDLVVPALPYEGHRGEAANAQSMLNAVPEGELVRHGEELSQPAAHALEACPDGAVAFATGAPIEGRESEVRQYIGGEEKPEEYRGVERFVEGQTATTATAENAGEDVVPTSPHYIDEKERDSSEQGAGGQRQTEDNAAAEVSSDETGKESAETPTTGTGGKEPASFSSSPMDNSGGKLSPRRRSARRRRRSGTWAPAAASRSTKRRKTQGTSLEKPVDGESPVRERTAGSAGGMETQEGFFPDINGVHGGAEERVEQGESSESHGTGDPGATEVTEQTKSGEGDLTSTRDEGECLSSQEIIQMVGEKESECLSAKGSASPSSQGALSPVTGQTVSQQRESGSCFHGATNEEILQGSKVHVNCDAAWMEEARADSHVRAFFVDCCADGGDEQVESGADGDSRARTSLRRGGGGRRKTGGDGRRRKKAEHRSGTRSGGGTAPAGAEEKGPSEPGETSPKDGDRGQEEEGRRFAVPNGGRVHGEGEEEPSEDENESGEDVFSKPELENPEGACEDGGSSYGGEGETTATGFQGGEKKGHDEQEEINGGIGENNSCDLHFLDDTYTPVSGGMNTQFEAYGHTPSAGEEGTVREENSKGGRRTRGSVRG